MAKQAPKGEFAKSHQGKTYIPGYDDKLVVSDDRTLQQKGGDLAIYADLLRDDQVSSTFQQRRLAVTSSEWIVEPGGTKRQDKAAADFMREQLTQIRWDDLTDKQLYSVFFGYGVAEIMWQRQGAYFGLESVKVRDRGRFAFGESGKLYLKKDIAQGGGYELMPERKFWSLNIGGDNHDQLYGVGLAQKLYWPVFFKRNDIKFWLVFLERFSGPTAVGRMPAAQFADERMKKEVLASLEAMATEGQIVIPETTHVDFVSSIYSGTADYATMCTQMDKAISKIVLSQTMTTDDGSSRSQSETHKSVRDEVVKADADLICESWNRGPGLWLTQLNFPNSAVPKVWRNTEPEEDLNIRAERDSKVYALGFEPTEDYIKENYGDGWVKRQSNPADDPLRVPQPADDVDPVFAELSQLTASKNAHRSDQQALAEAAKRYARDYQTVLGAQVEQLVQFLEDSDDFDTFKRRMGEVLGQDPTEEQIQTIQRGGVVSRLMGMLRGS